MLALSLCLLNGFSRKALGPWTWLEAQTERREIRAARDLRVSKNGRETMA